MKLPARLLGAAHGSRATLALLAAATLGACAVGPDFHTPAPPKGEHVVAAPPPDALATPAGAQHFAHDADVAARWWQAFGAPELDHMVDEALAHSPTMAAAQATLRQSEHQLRAGYGVFFPQLGVDVNAVRERTVLETGGAPAGIGPYNLTTAAASVSYIPDLFGGQRRTVEALGAQRDVQRYGVLAAYLSLTSNVVNTAIARAGYEAQRDALRDVIRMQDDQIRIARIQFNAGTSAYTAVVALQSQQAANEASIAALEQHIEQSEHLLAQLQGRPPAEAALPELALEALRLPAELPDALPSKLARQRPDILAAEASLHAASAQIGVATADLFPSLTLVGTPGVAQSTAVAALHQGISIWSAQAELSASVFSGLSGWYTRRAAIDAYQASLSDYQQAVLAGLTQVADTMTALAHDAQAVRAQADSLEAAEEGLRLTRANYEAGTAGYLDLLNSDTQVQQARLGFISAVAQRLQDTVALYAALGGGWWNRGS